MPLKPDGEYIEIPEYNHFRKLFTQGEIKIDGIKSFGYQTLMLDECIPEHYHKNCFEFHYMVQGSITFWVGGQQYTMKDGDIFVTLPNERHKSLGHNNLVRRLYWFSVACDENLLGLTKERSDYILKSLYSLKNRLIPVEDEMKYLFKNVFDNITLPEQCSRIYASAQMTSLLCKIIGFDALPLSRNVSGEIAASLEFIEKNKYHNIPLEDAAESCHMSLSNFKIRFKAETGVTPALYIQKQRIECAKELLKSGHSVTETAFTLGFGSSNYFSTVFRRITFMTPTQYINNEEA